MKEVQPRTLALMWKVSQHYAHSNLFHEQLLKLAEAERSIRFDILFLYTLGAGLASSF